MKLDKIDKLLLDSGFEDFKAADLLVYMRDATVAREYGKFVFTKSVSDILELIAEFSCENGLSRDEISHVSLNSILEVLSASGEISIEEHLRDLSDSGKVKHQISSAIRLPQLLVDQSDIHVVPFQVSHPNFITTKAVTGKCLMLTSDMKEVSLEGKIVLIEGADPGFDWIFSQNIIGLITKYGGANSHMAIRSAEFDMPAAIGCGEQRFDRLLQANNIHLDCSAGLINPLN
jgi:phosphohistidine swiveling domain-containing protein